MADNLTLAQKIKRARQNQLALARETLERLDAVKARNHILAEQETARVNAEKQKKKRKG